MLKNKIKDIIYCILEYVFIIMYRYFKFIFILIDIIL